jgi:hypothetical protein
MEAAGISSGLLGIAVSTSRVRCLHDKPDQTCEYTAFIASGGLANERLLGTGHVTKTGQCLN